EVQGAGRGATQGASLVAARAVRPTPAQGAPRASELVAEVVPRVATAACQAATPPAQGAPSVLASLWGEQQPGARTHRDAQHDAGDDERGLTPAPGWPRAAETGPDASGGRPGGTAR